MWRSAPSFWQNNDSIASRLLQPVSGLYQCISGLRNHYTKTTTVSQPVICIGNLTAGGAGKTPIAIALSKILQQYQVNIAFLSRGYGGNYKGVHNVNPEIDSAHSVGDEPLLLSQHAAAWISRNRITGANNAIEAGAEVIIMDDGFQNPSIAKDLSVIVIDGNYGLGNQRIIPAGPLRETLENALERTQAVIIIGDDRHHIAQQIPPSIPVLAATLKPAQGYTLPSKRYIAFAGIGNPNKFFSTLQSLECDLIATFPFPDHYPYTESDLQRLLAIAHDTNAHIITTEKDWVRIPKPLQPQIGYLPVVIHWENEAQVIEVLKPVLQRLGKVT